MKIIHILCHEPYNITYETKNPEELKKFWNFDYIKIKEKPYWIGFFHTDHHAILAKHMKPIDSNIKHECWRPYGFGIKQEYSMEIDRITHRVFPFHTFKIPRTFRLEWSFKIAKELKNVSAREDIKVILYDSHSFFSAWLRNHLRHCGIKFIVYHLGGYFAVFNNKSFQNIFQKLLWNYQMKALNNTMYHFTNSVSEVKYLNGKGFFNTETMLIGFDFKKMPNSDKLSARNKLGLPPNKKLILYAGRFNEWKGISYIIDSYLKLKKERADIDLVVVGGYKEDEYYQKAVESGAYVFERTTENNLYLYYSACDVYVMAVYDENYINFAGYGIAPAQAGYYGLPVITDNLINFTGSEIERSALGTKIGSINKLSHTLNNVLNNTSLFNPKPIIEKYFNIETTATQLLNKCKEY